MACETDHASARKREIVRFGRFVIFLALRFRRFTFRFCVFFGSFRLTNLFAALRFVSFQLYNLSLQSFPIRCSFSFERFRFKSIRYSRFDSFHRLPAFDNHALFKWAVRWTHLDLVRV